MKNSIIAILALLIVGLGAYVLMQNPSQTIDTAPRLDTAAGTTTPQGGEVQSYAGETIIGQSVEGRDLVAYRYGTGDTELLFIGDVHGGYTWNTALLAYQTMDYLKANPDAVPATLRVTVIPVLNPDGLYRVVGTSTAAFTRADVAPSSAAQIAGRFNANNVDLNRNFDCDWKSSTLWQGRTVSGGAEVFSEPESRAIRDYIETHTPAAVVVWYAASGGVFASSCHNGVSLEALALTDRYAKASGYKAYESFNFYDIPGDMVNWLAKKGIPAVSVLLATHTDTEWTKNLAGIKAVIAHYAQE